jgi:hypothetical protein
MGRQCEAPVAIAATMAAPQRGQPFAESALDRRLRPVERPTSPFSAVLALWSPAGHGGPSRDTRAPGGLVLGLVLAMISCDVGRSVRCAVTDIHVTSADYPPVNYKRVLSSVDD